MRRECAWPWPALHHLPPAVSSLKGTLRHFPVGVLVTELPVTWL